MKTNRMNVGYHLVRNGTSTADKAPYLGVAVPVGSLAYGNILRRMLDRGTHMTLATAKYFLNELYEFAGKKISDDIVRINMGAVSIYPKIGGPFDSEDDEFRAPRNTLYVGATLSQEIRDAVSGVVPTNLGAESANGTVKIGSVMDLASETYHLIDGLKEFRIVGIDLTVPDGEDESLTLVAADGATKAADITVISTEDGQRIVCTLASAVPAGTYYVRLVSHGLDPAAPLTTALHKVSVKAASIPPAPESIDETSDGQVKVMTFTDGGQNAVFDYGHTWNATGLGFEDSEAGWFIQSVTVKLSENDGYACNFNVASPTAFTATGDDGEVPAAGTYPNAWVELLLSVTGGTGDEHEKLRLPINLRVG